VEAREVVFLVGAADGVVVLAEADHQRIYAEDALPRRTAKANASKSAVRAHVEHPFAHQKGIMRLVIRTIARARAEAAVTLSNMACNMKRSGWLNRRSASA
jgi:hypothetical protein